MRRSLQKAARRKAFQDGDWFPFVPPETPFEKRWFDLRRAVVLWRRVSARQKELARGDSKPVHCTVAIDRGSWVVGISAISVLEMVDAQAEAEQLKQGRVHTSPLCLRVPELVRAVVFATDTPPRKVHVKSIKSLEHVLVLDDQDVRNAENAHVKGEPIWGPPLSAIDMICGLSKESIQILCDAYDKVIDAANCFELAKHAENAIAANFAISRQKLFVYRPSHQ